MKKFIALVLALICILTFAACGDTGDKATDTDGKSSGDVATTKTPDATPSGDGINTGMKKKYDTMEYTLYTNIFYNEMADDYVGQKQTKEGTFTTLYDAWSGVERYYVWGFADQTECCDFQWEIVMPEGTEIPANGSFVTMTGTFTADEAALDGYWFTDVTLEVQETYTPADYDYDTTTMSGTLARVQILNFEYKADQFDGKTALIYGRALTTATIQHPYYDEAWSMDFINAGAEPAIGTYLLIGGTITPSGDTAILDVTYYTETE